MDVLLLFHFLALFAAGTSWAFLRRRPRWPALLGAATGLGLTLLLLARLLAAGHTGFFFFRLLAGAAFLWLPLFLLAAAFLPLPRAPRLFAALAGLTLGGIGCDAFWIEPFRLELEPFAIVSEKLARPLRVVVVADLQTDRFGDYERGALRQVMELRGDLILFTGDYLQEADPTRHAALRAQVRSFLGEIGLRAPLGVYAVRGDVERDDWAELFAGLPVRTFEQTTRIELPDLTLTALRSRDSRNHQASIPPSEKFHLIFGHAPDFALDQPPGDLLVAGHTHGGQVRLPGIGPLLTLSEVPRAWAAGLSEIAPGRYLVVSRGIGMERGEAPRLRFLCRPQIVTIDLVPGPAAPGVQAIQRSITSSSSFSVKGLLR